MRISRSMASSLDVQMLVAVAPLGEPTKSLNI